VSYQLLALDIDGTILNNYLEIQPAVAAAIKAAQDRGIHVTLATGRMFKATLPIAQQLHIQEPLICYQGGMVRDPVTGEIYAQATMDGALAAEAVEMLHTAGIFVIAYVDERLCIFERRAELEMYLRWHTEGTEVVVAPDLPSYVVKFPPTKLLFIAEPEIVEHELVRLAGRFGDSLAVLRSHELFGELTSPGTSKGAALKILAERLGIAREDVMAIGDQENDLPMIAWAGLGLAMGNAIPAVRAAADAVIPSVEEAGVAWAIEHYLLAEERLEIRD
jgi:Cof subfamily protein (haloacid dehalogenase superfamily)